MALKTVVTRGGKTIQVKVRSVARTMTAATLLATLPRGSRVLGLVLSGVASNAGTTATLSFGTSTASNELVNAANALAAGVGNGVQLLSGVAGAVGGYTNSNNPVTVYGLYAETGIASSAGAWKVYILYTTGNDLDDDTV